MGIAVAFDSVSKTYRRGRPTSLAERVGRLAHKRRRETQLGGTVKALQDVSFEIPEGASVALMGANGSGKTTALKIITRVTYPSAGQVHVRGRVGALIEVGAGLHPELTGRENIQLYGRILGLSGRAIARHFDSIVEFAAIGDAIDQPVKQYSTGMHLRLGFSLASHIEPDILIVDEAVSVGDAGFQRRCVQRMATLTDSGATLIFVSHVPALVSTLCRTGILLRSGRCEAMQPVDQVVSQYLGEVVGRADDRDDIARTIRVRSWDYDFRPRSGRFLGDLSVRVQMDVSVPAINPCFGVAIGRSRQGALIACSMIDDKYQVGTVQGPIVLGCSIHELPLEPGGYEVWVTATEEPAGTFLLAPTLLGFVFLGPPPRAGTTAYELAGTLGEPVVRAPYEWSVEPAFAHVDTPQADAGHATVSPT